MRARLLLLVAVLALALAACSGGSEEPTTTDTDTGDAAAATFVGDDSLKWESAPDTAELVDGELTLTIECSGAVPHNIAIEGVQDDAVLADCTEGESGTATVSLEPGTYTYYCAIPGHREAGMEGELTVS